MTYRLIEFFSFFLFSGNLIFCFNNILSDILLFMSDESCHKESWRHSPHFHFRLKIQFVANKSQLDVSSKKAENCFQFERLL